MEPTVSLLFLVATGYSEPVARSSRHSQNYKLLQLPYSEELYRGQGSRYCAQTNLEIMSIYALAPLIASQSKSCFQSFPKFKSNVIIRA